MKLAASLLALLMLPVMAQAQGRAVSAMPTPLTAPLADDAPDLSDYETLITQTPPPEPAVAPAPRPRRPAVVVQEGGQAVKRGNSVENGVTVYRGVTPAR